MTTCQSVRRARSIMPLTVSLAVATSMAMGSASAQNSDTLEEVVVTALKREQSLQEVPVSIAVVDGNQLEDFKVDSLFAVANFASGMVMSRAPDDGISLTFRGLGTAARNQSFESSVGVFADGLFFGKGRMLTPDFFDVQRIEFLKGTQSTLLGKNTSVGGINIVSHTPGDQLGGNVTVNREFVNGGWTADGAVDLPAADAAKFRVAIHYKDQNGWVRNEATGNDGPKSENFGARLTGTFQPAESVDVTARYQYSDSSLLGNAWQPIAPSGVVSGPGYPNGPSEAILDDRSNQYTTIGKDGESYHTQEMHLASLSASWSLAAHTLSSQTSYATYDTSFYDDFDFEPVDFNTMERQEDYRQFSQEVRLASASGGRLDYIAGLYYFHSNWQSVETQRWGVPNFFGPPEIPVPPFPDRALFNGSFINDFAQKLDSYSGFVHGTLHMTDAWSLTGGLRYTEESKDIEFGRRPLGPLHFWNTGANPPFPLTPLKFDDNFINGNLSVQFKLTSDTMVYASYGRGSKLGGFAESTSVPDANPAVSAFIDTETTQTYEVGAKNTLDGGSINLNAAVFYTDVDDYQQTTFVNGAFLTENIPVTSRGAEIEAMWQIAAPVRVSLSATYADAIDESIDKRVPTAPKWTVNAGWFYEQSVGTALEARFSGNVRYRGAMFSQAAELAPSSSWTTLDLSLGIGAADERWAAAVVAVNVTNAKSADFGGDSPDASTCSAANGCQLRSLGQLRNISLQLKASF